MITMMVLLCYVNLSGMSLECIVILLMNNSLLLGGQLCTDYVNVQQGGNNAIGHDRLAIIPRLSFTCNGIITGITARVWFSNGGSNYPFLQVWRPASVGSTVYDKIGEVQLQSDSQVTRGSNNRIEANIILTGNNTIEVHSGDVVGYYHPPDARYRVATIRNSRYILYQFSGSHESVDLNSATNEDDDRQPLIQFNIRKYAVNQHWVDSKHEL